MKNPRLPERPRAHQLDDEACREVEQLLKPHIVEPRGKHDYGKDLLVRLVDHSEASHKVTGREFSIQVKGSDSAPEESVVVEVKSLNSWLNSIEPVLLAKVFRPETPDAKLRAVWIDGELHLHLNRTSPNWREQTSVTLPLPLEPKREQLADIERYVKQWRAGRFHTVWDPSEFSIVETEAADLAAELQRLSTAAEVDGPTATLRAAAKHLERLAYSVALLGNSRVGKSTLLNRLLGRDISPVLKLPTTAVVMSVGCGEDDTATVRFLDGTEKVGPPTSKFLSPYMTQQENPDNEKRVAHVAVRVPDRILATGIMLLDLPGFHDSDPEIRAISEAALKRINACVYLIDVAPFSSGSLSFSEQHVADLKALLATCDRVILGLSKADRLKRLSRAVALEYVTAQLTKYGLLDQLATPPVFIGVSSKQEKGQERHKDPVWLSSDELKSEVWRILLKDGDIASARVHEVLSGIISAHEDLVRATKARLLEGNRASEVAKKLTAVETEITHINSMVQAQCKDILATASQRVNHETHGLIARAESWIRSVPSTEPLPEAKDVRARLYSDAQRMVTTEIERLNLGMSDIKLEAERRVHSALEQLPIGKLERVPSISSPEVPEIAPFPLSALQDGFWGSVVVSVGAWVFGGAITAGLTLLGFLAGMVLGKDTSRAKDVEKRIETIKGHGEKIEGQVFEAIRKVVIAFQDELVVKTRERGTYAVHDLRKALKVAGKAITPSQAEELKSLLGKLAAIGGRLQKLYARAMKVTGVPLKLPNPTAG